MRIGRTSAAALVSVLLAGIAAWAAGEVWRTPEKFPKATGPSSVELSPGGKVKKGSAIHLEVLARDGAQAPVDGLAVAALGLFGKKDKLERLATDSAGKVVVNGLGLTGLAVGFQWDGGAKTIKARLEPDKNGWRVVEAPYKRIIDGQDAGSCKNLFTLAKADGADRYRLEMRVPTTLLECEEVAYGVERKVGEIARVADIGSGRDVNLGDKNAFTADDERKIGLEASTHFDQQFQKIDDPEIVGYVKRLMEKIAAASDMPKMPINLRVVHTNDVNAFVTAGGHVYVFTGLIAMAQNESQLAGVLAHEGSHAIARHVTEGATRGKKAQTGASAASAALGALGALVGVGEGGQALIQQGVGTAAGIITLKYDRRAETEADLLGSQYLWKAGWDPEAIARFFEILGSQSSGQGSPPAWMSTHPPHERRVENGIQWARAFLPPRDRYLLDTAEFQAIQAKVRKLPPPKPAPVPPEGQKSLVQLMAESETWKNALAAPSE